MTSPGCRTSATGSTMPMTACATLKGPSLPLKPSEYMKRQVWATFQFETENVGFTCEKYGADKLMWSSDYPHTDSPWPRSREFIETWIGTIGEGQKQRVVGGNAAELYHVS